ncbi:MAG: type II toxin-antitoxin system RelE/ParE family toxin [Planctomycetaceae bacterium]
MAEIAYYQCADGSCPFERWFANLDARAAVKVTTAIERMAEGNPGDVKSVGSGVWERRIAFGPGYRLYFGRDGKEVLVLLIGGTKQRQPTAIRQAKALWAEYQRRKKET